MSAAETTTGSLAFEVLNRPNLTYDDNLDLAIVTAVSYVDGFDYPLTANEIHRYLVRTPLSGQQVREALERPPLVPTRLSHVDQFYTLPGRENIVETRQKRQAAAQKLWPLALHYGRLIAGAPFVRMVAISGSLAVGNANIDDDIDLFIITEDNYLWLCRAFVLAIVRYAAVRGVELCPNYFLALSAQGLAEQNIYTAHEVAQMVPLSGNLVYQQFRESNRWVDDYLPNAAGPPPNPVGGQSFLEIGAAEPGMTERLLRGAFGRRFNDWEMNRKIRKFQNTQPDWQESSFSAVCCKGHFHNHRRRSLEAFDQRLTEMEG